MTLLTFDDVDSWKVNMEMRLIPEVKKGMSKVPDQVIRHLPDQVIR